MWTRCADTPVTLCAGWGNSCGNGEGKYRPVAASCANTVHRLCGRKTLAAIFRLEDPQALSTAAWSRTVDGTCAEAPAGAAPGCYDSTVCSIEGAALRRVAEAIDRLEADRGNTDAADLAARVAAIWSMVSEIDPELARLASGYQTPRSLRP